MFRAIVSVILILGPTFFFGVKGDTGAMAVGAAAGAAAAIVLYMDQVELIELLGFKAKLRKKVEEVTKTASALRELARETIAANIQMVTLDGRWGGGLSTADRIATVNRLRQVAAHLEIEDTKEIEAAVGDHHRYMAFDFFSHFESGCVNGGYPPGTRNDLAPLSSIAEGKEPNRDEIMSVFAKHGVEELRPEDRERLEDYLYYREHHKPRW